MYIKIFLLASLVLKGTSGNAGPAEFASEKPHEILSLWSSEGSFEQRLDALALTLEEMSRLRRPDRASKPPLSDLLWSGYAWRRKYLGPAVDPNLEARIRQRAGALVDDPTARDAVRALLLANIDQIKATIVAGDSYVSSRNRIKAIWRHFAWGGGPAEAGMIGPMLFVSTSLGSGALAFVAEQMYNATTELSLATGCGVLLGAAVPAVLTVVWKIPETLLHSALAVARRLRAGQQMRRLIKQLNTPVAVAPESIHAG